MKLLSYLTLAAAAALTLSSPLRASDTKERQTTDTKGRKVMVVGTLVDSKCFGMMRSNSENDHQSPDGLMKNCATKCAEQGIPVALVQPNGTVVILAAPAKIFGPYMAQHARVVGMVPFGGTIIPEKVEVRSEDGEWKEVKIETMM